MAVCRGVDETVYINLTPAPHLTTAAINELMTDEHESDDAEQEQRPEQLEHMEHVEQVEPPAAAVDDVAYY